MGKGIGGRLGGNEEIGVGDANFRKATTVAAGEHAAMNDDDDRNVEPLEYARMKEIRPLATGDSPRALRFITVALSAIVVGPFVLGIPALIWMMIFL